jgi:hypothetical protein
MGAWFLSLPSACQIDNNGYITNITYLGCFLI